MPIQYKTQRKVHLRSVLARPLSSAALLYACLSACIDPQADAAHDTTPIGAFDAFNVAGSGSLEASEDLASEGYDVVGVDMAPDVAGVEEDVSVVPRAALPPELLEDLDQHALIPKSLVGDDTRLPVFNTRIDPYKTVVRLFTKYVKTGKTYGCSGTLIGPDAVLTAAHCVFNSSRTSPGYAYSVTVVPGLYPKSPVPTTGTRYETPFGTSTGAKLFLPQRYIDNEADPYNKIQYDYAVIRLKSSLGNAGTKPFGVLSSALNKTAVLNGYHGDLPEGDVLEKGLVMYNSQDKVRKVLDNDTFNHYIDTDKGSSGAGITGTGSWSGKIFGVNSSEVEGGVPYNIAAQITNNNYRTIVDWAVRTL